MSEPFEELSRADQQNVIDVAVAVAVLNARITATANPTFFSLIIQEFTRQYDLPPSLTRSAFKHVGASLFAQDWVFHARKAEQSFVTSFRPIAGSGPDQEPPDLLK